MHIRHWAISKKDDSTLAQFLQRLANDVASLEKNGSQIDDIVFNMPDDSTDTPHTVATVYYRDGNEDAGYDMQVMQIRSSVNTSPALALSESLARLKDWTSMNEEAEVFELKIDMLVSKDGSDMARATVY